MAFALTQHTGSYGFASGTSTSKAFAGSPANGALLLVMLFLNNNTATISSAPTGASITGSWVPMAGTNGTQSAAAAAQTFQCFGAINNATGTSTISLSWTGTGTGDMVICEFSGITGSVVEDGSSVSANTSGTAVTTPSFTPTITGDLLIQAAMTSNGVTASSGGTTPAWTAGDTLTQMTGTGDGWGYANGTTGAQAAHMTINNSSATTTVVVFGIEASGGGGSTGIPDLIMAPPHR